MKTRFHTVFQIILIALMICTVSFTFTQSALSKEASTQVSETVKEVIETILPADTETGEFVQENVRELAHFFEFAALGFLVSLYVALYMPEMGICLSRKKAYIAASYACAPIIALFDETIQFFSHRAPDVLDVWLDTAGYVSFATLTYAAFLLVVYIRKRRLSKSEQN